jgi:hypothetical protein
VRVFLSPDDIYKITHKRQRAAQKRVLRELGYVFDEDALGWPLILRSTVERRHAPGTSARRGPDSAALASLMRDAE